MKKMISFVLSMMMLLGLTVAQAETAAVAPGSRLGFQVLDALADGEGNRVISPVSLAYALAMAAEGADGVTEDELERALGADDLDDWAEVMTKRLRKAGLSLANAAFITGDMRPEADYVEDLREDFDAEWFENDGDMVEKINGWAAEKTNGLIDRLLDQPLDPLVRLVLINAVAMDAKWSAPFDPAATFEGTFHAPGGDVPAQMMTRELYADYVERDGVQMIRLGYMDSGLTMLIALPEEGGMDAVLKALCDQGLGYFDGMTGETKVHLTLPKLDLSVTNELADVLKALGIQTAFSDDADFSDISETTPLKIGSVLQKVRLMVDEDGTKAAAATAAIMETRAALQPEEIVEMTVDRPFVVLIADEASDVTCFAGVIANPAEN